MDKGIRSSQELEQKTNGKRINKLKAVQQHHAAGEEFESFRYDNEFPRIYGIVAGCDQQNIQYFTFLSQGTDLATGNSCY